MNELIEELELLTDSSATCIEDLVLKLIEGADRKYLLEYSTMCSDRNLIKRVRDSKNASKQEEDSPTLQNSSVRYCIEDMLAER